MNETATAPRAKTTTLEITWRAFTEEGPATHIQARLDAGKETTSVAITVEHDGTDLALCEEVFRQTNMYDGDIWDRIQPLMSDNRTHTALSVGDYVRVGDNVYKCADMGFVLVEKDGRPWHELTRGWLTGTPVCGRCGALCEDDDDGEDA
jgi:hypothetical protein